MKTCGINTVLLAVLARIPQCDRPATKRLQGRACDVEVCDDHAKGMLRSFPHLTETPIEPDPAKN